MIRNDDQLQCDGDELPDWLDVLEGMSDSDLSELEALFALPVCLGKCGSNSETPANDDKTDCSDVPVIHRKTPE